MARMNKQKEASGVTEMMQEYAEQAVAAAREYQIKLDYSEESLRAVEQVLDGLARERTGDAGEGMERMCMLWGGYFGEVVRRRWGGEWSIEKHPGANFATLTLNVGGSKLFPSMKVYRRLTNGEADNLWMFYEQVKQSLEKRPGSGVQ